MAGPLFTIQDRAFLEEIRIWVQEASADSFLPHIDNGDNNENRAPGKSSKELLYSIFKNDIEAVDKSDAIIALLDGVPQDVGTAIELGYAYSKKKPILGLRSDFRVLGNFDTQIIDLMVQNVCSDLVFESNGNKEILKKGVISFIEKLKD
ncbi:MAG: nucleoside 2-deoxyribosyltransferase [Pseudomonadota bacterium]